MEDSQPQATQVNALTFLDSQQHQSSPQNSLQKAVPTFLGLVLLILAGVGGYFLGNRSTSETINSVNIDYVNNSNQLQASPEEKARETMTSKKEITVCENGQILSSASGACKLAITHSCQESYVPYIFSVGNVELCIPEAWKPEHTDMVIPAEKYHLSFAIESQDKNKRMNADPVFTVSMSGDGFDSGAYCHKKGELFRVGNRTFQTYEVYLSQGSHLNPSCGIELLHKTIEVPINKKLLFFSVGLEPLSETNKLKALQEIEAIVRDTLETK